ncbi:MAG: hypothetical protein UZ17_ACD001001516 [Acidobacteria bacterium OLB17]|nr:MAG: hypothetical protein UZ17_ACD001001516 [Acidobacteria bacterium OLB17]MCZ2391320.1 hypothetical protein [Acidobacteriota bacterium]
MTKYAVLVVLLITHGVLIAQESKSITSEPVEVLGPTLSGFFIGTLPRSRVAELKRVTVTMGRTARYCDPECLISTFGSETFTLAESTAFFDRSIHASNGEDTVHYVSHPTFFPSIVVGNSLYIFAGKELQVNVEIFNRFTKAVAFRIGKVGEAEDFARFFLAATSEYFERTDNLVISRVEDVPINFRRMNPGGEIKVREKVRPPIAREVGKCFEVTLYAWEASLGEVLKWTFNVRRDGQLRVQKKVVGII